METNITEKLFEDNFLVLLFCYKSKFELRDYLEERKVYLTPNKKHSLKTKSLVFHLS